MFFYPTGTGQTVGKVVRRLHDEWQMIEGRSGRGGGNFLVFPAQLASSQPDARMLRLCRKRRAVRAPRAYYCNCAKATSSVFPDAANIDLVRTTNYMKCMASPATPHPRDVFTVTGGMGRKTQRSVHRKCEGEPARPRGSSRSPAATEFPLVRRREALFSTSRDPVH
jgi:hypothetical protein